MSILFTGLSDQQEAQSVLGKSIFLNYELA